MCKSKITRWGIAAMLFVMLGMGEWRSSAQGTAFTYQGRLDDGGLPASGEYDLKLSVYNAVTNGSMLGSSNILENISITNGLFTVAFDPGANVFDGNPRWLEIAVRPGDSLDSFTALTPRQRILPAPMAIYAGKAATVVTGSVSAISIAAGQVVKGVNGLTDGVLLSGGNNISLTTNGNNISIHTAPGLLSWETVTGLAQAANTNHGYLLTSDPRPTLTLPAAANLSDIVRVSGVGSNGWKLAQNAGQSIRLRNLPGNISVNWMPRDNARAWSGIASSADGRKLLAAVSGGQLYVSTDGGISWTARDSNRAWTAVASSEFGVYLVAAVSGGQLYVSTNSGATWTPRDANRNWVSVCCSADGSVMVAGNSGGNNHISTDYGLTWTLFNGAPGGKVACSRDAGAIVVAVNGGQIYRTIDFGQNWTPLLGNAAWTGIASSADGSKLVAVVNLAQIYTSADYGATWAVHESSRAWSSVASSADGSRLIATVNTGSSNNIYTSHDGGATWYARENTRNWTSSASSADGTRLVATASGGQVYTSDNLNPTTTVGANGYLLGEPFSAVELQYIGNNQFMPLSHEGLIIGF